jgi:hypothetical protein
MDRAGTTYVYTTRAEYKAAAAKRGSGVPCALCITPVRSSVIGREGGD